MGRELLRFSRGYNHEIEFLIVFMTVFELVCDKVNGKRGKTLYLCMPMTPACDNLKYYS